MKVTLENTDQIVQLGIRDPETEEVVTVPARIWEGTTESGICVHAFITRICVHKDLDNSQFARELQEQQPLSKALRDVYDARMMIL